jgi:hypothetical protein
MALDSIHELMGAPWGTVVPLPVASREQNCLEMVLEVDVLQEEDSAAVLRLDNWELRVATLYFNHRIPGASPRITAVGRESDAGDRGSILRVHLRTSVVALDRILQVRSFGTEGRHGGGMAGWAILRIGVVVGFGITADELTLLQAHSALMARDLIDTEPEADGETTCKVIARTCELVSFST